MAFKLIITKDKKNNNRLYSALINEKKKLVELNVCSIHEEELIGKIYIGKVINVIKGMNAAFINIGLEKNAYMSLDKLSNVIFTNNKKSGKITQGDEVVVQVIKEPHGSKGAVVSPDISLTGRFLVLTKNKNFVGISNKIIADEERDRLKNIVEKYVTEHYGFIIRTNANYIEEHLIVSEIEELIQTYNTIISTAEYRTCYTQLYGGISPIIKIIRDMYDINVEEYIIEDKDVFNDVREYMENVNPSLIDKIKLYEDKQLSLFDLYGLESRIEKALNEKVWLKSGGSIVIQPTEALVSIDVNTAKFVGKKNFEETVFKANIEAAKEIARQLRLRNLSGIIIVDFIDMKNKEHNEALLEQFSKYLTKDRNKTFLLGMTKLGLVELTRKKVSKPLYEQIKTK